MEKLEIICAGHIFRKKEPRPEEIIKPPYCEICTRDKDNKKCPWYYPIKIHTYGK